MVRFWLVLAIGVLVSKTTCANQWTLTPAELQPPPSQSTQQVSQGPLNEDVVRIDESGDIAAAWYSDPSKKPNRGVLGETMVASILKVKAIDGKILTHKLPNTQMFKDRKPWLFDLGGQGKTNIITILTDASLGLRSLYSSLKKIPSNCLHKHPMSDKKTNGVTSLVSEILMVMAVSKLPKFKRRTTMAF